jgi:hypothetical protein
MKMRPLAIEKKFLFFISAIFLGAGCMILKKNKHFVIFPHIISRLLFTFQKQLSVSEEGFC